MNKTLLTLIGASAMTLATAVMAMPAGAFGVSFILTGDPRPGNPDLMRVDLDIYSGQTVTGFGTVATNQALFKVTPNSAADHPGMKLDQFFFNVASRLNKSLLTFSNYDPTDWKFSSGNNAVGSGSADFTFGINDSPGQPKQDIFNGDTLTFLMTSTQSGIVFTAADFAPPNVPFSNGDAILGPMFYGAHVQSLSVNTTTCPQENCSDSGFVSVPEPLTLLGSGIALGFGAHIKRKLAKSAIDKAEA